MFLWEIGLDMKEVGPAHYNTLNKSRCKNRGKTEITIKVATTNHLENISNIAPALTLSSHIQC